LGRGFPVRDEEGNMRMSEIENMLEGMMDRVFETLNHHFDEFIGMTVEEEKKVLEYMEQFYPKIDLVDYFNCWMEMNAEDREEEEVA
jgi:hypothetical protein